MNAGVIMKNEKTNVMRLLDKAKIGYSAHEYPHGKDAVDGVTVAALSGFDPETVFKTLVARGVSKKIYVFVIPVAHELDLKKAAKAAGEKSVEMVHVNELLALTGYIRGGCSPLGMKKRYPTFINESALDKETVFVSAGKIGSQVGLSPDDLSEMCTAKYYDLVKSE